MTFKCKLPWQALHIIPGIIAPCCNFSRVGPPPASLDEYINSAELKSVRDQLLQGVAPRECKNCVHEEAISGRSHRTLSNRFEDNDPVHEFEDVSIVTSNTCNLKCTSCTGNSSFVRGVELTKMGLAANSPGHFTHTLDIDALINYPIKSLTISGGEPFVDSTREVLDKLVHAGRSTVIDLRLNSNCTMITPDWLEYLDSNFKSTMIKASLDGVGAVNDYLRYPSKWDEIEANLAMLKDYPNITAALVTSVLSNLSVIRFHDLINWCVDNNIEDLVVLTLRNPVHMQPHVLPAELKQQLLLTYTELRETHKDAGDRILECIDTCIGICSNQISTADEFTRALEWYQAHDRHRGNNIFDVFPELKPYEQT